MMRISSKMNVIIRVEGINLKKLRFKIKKIIFLIRCRNMITFFSIFLYNNKV